MVAVGVETPGYLLMSLRDRIQRLPLQQFSDWAGGVVDHGDRTISGRRQLMREIYPQRAVERGGYIRGRRRPVGRVAADGIGGAHYPAALQAPSSQDHAPALRPV